MIGIVNRRSVSYSQKEAVITETIGFIGSGNMCEALAGGLINKKAAKSDQISCSDTSQSRLNTMN